MARQLGLLIFGFALSAILSPVALSSPRETVLYSFLDGNDGAYPISALLSDGHGTFYGTTAGGGGLGTCAFYEPYCGTVFSLTRGPSAWQESVLHSFAGGNDGALPIGQLVRDKSGNLYGVTQFGGGAGCNGGGCGTVFALSPSSDGSWAESIIYSFSGGADGSHPYAGLLLDTSGHLYGTASEGGAYGSGVVFELTPEPDGSWSEKALYAFYDYYEGAYPTARVIMDKTGNLFSTTFSGGDYNAGTVFELTPDSKGGWKETVLHSFNGKSEGRNPNAGLVADKHGNLFGATDTSTPGAGAVFEMVNSGGSYTFKTIHRFKGVHDGNTPFADLNIDTSGRLFGTTMHGGDDGVGTVFRLVHTRTGWTETVLHSFVNTDGGNPAGAVVFDSAGKLYGTTFRGGAGTGCRFDGCGVVFELGP